jgi:hypothetical protein
MWRGLVVFAGRERREGKEGKNNQQQRQKQIPSGMTTKRTTANQKDNCKPKGQLQKEQKQEGQSNRFEW